jgi:hypothetical protein
LRSVPLDDDAYATYIPQIIANNPGIQILHDRVEVHLRLSAGPGGSVTVPGEGDFTYQGRTEVVVEAQPDPGFVFGSFSGTATSSLNPFFFTVEYDCDVRANFITWEHPFDCIQEALEVASKGATIFVRAGTYCETIDLLGKQVELTGFDPNDPNSAAWPVLQGDGKGPIVSFTHGEDPACMLSGFLITGGKGRTAGAIRCITSSPTVANCLIVGNLATEWNGAAILCTDSHANFINCTIADNRGGQFGAALSTVNDQVTVVNCVFWNNWPKDVASEGDLLPGIHYSIVSGNWAGRGNIATNPLFAASGRWVDRDNPAVTVPANDPVAIWLLGDYHVQSQAGRWDPMTGLWLQDDVTSPCIDAGDPATPVGSEPSPNGGIINLGAYGGTAEASKSPAGGSSS